MTESTSLGNDRRVLSITGDADTSIGSDRIIYFRSVEPPLPRFSRLLSASVVACDDRSLGNLNAGKMLHRSRLSTPRSQIGSSILWESDWTE